jgi:hypothetical protein
MIKWSMGLMKFICEDHPEARLTIAHKGISTGAQTRGYDLKAHKCTICGCESTPAIHEDLGL